MTGKPHAFVDLEGVLAPEMWPFPADRLGIAALRPTTREAGDDPKAGKASLTVMLFPARGCAPSMRRDKSAGLM